MANVDRVAARVEDVRELIPVGTYGLYELIWTLNSQYPELDWQAKVEDSMSAVEQFVREDGVRIVMLNWPSGEIVREALLSDISPSDFENPPRVLHTLHSRPGGSRQWIRRGVSVNGVPKSPTTRY